MKRIFTLVLFVALSCVVSTKAQDVVAVSKAAENPLENRHDGFYYSIGLGTHFGNMTHKIDQGPYQIDYNYKGGSGLTMDFKIGWAVMDNLIAHLGTILEATYEPTIKDLNGETVDFDYTFGTGAIMYGIGGTYYVMPYNAFVSATLGFSTFATVQQVPPTPDDILHGNNEIETELAKTDPGFAFQFKLGKEWWISKNWGIGLAFTYTNMSVDYKRSSMDKANEKMDSGKYGILLNATFN